MNGEPSSGPTMVRRWIATVLTAVVMGGLAMPGVIAHAADDPPVCTNPDIDKALKTIDETFRRITDQLVRERAMIDQNLAKAPNQDVREALLRARGEIQD